MAHSDPNKSIIPALKYTSLNHLYDQFSIWAFRKTAFGMAIKALVEELKIKQTPKVLELGCGPGRLAIKIKMLFPGCEMTAVDGDPAILKIAKVNAQRAGVQIAFATQDITSLSLSKTYDRIYSTFVFHHLNIKGKERALLAMRKHLAPKGFFLLADFCQHQNLPDRLKFLPVQLIDGFQTTSPQRDGWLEENLPRFLGKVHKAFETATFLGRVGVFICSK